MADAPFPVPCPGDFRMWDNTSWRFPRSFVVIDNNIDSPYYHTVDILSHMCERSEIERVDAEYVRLFSVVVSGE